MAACGQRLSRRGGADGPPDRGGAVPFALFGQEGPRKAGVRPGQAFTADSSQECGGLALL